MRAQCDGQPQELERVDSNTLRSPPSPCSHLELRYDVYADEDSPFSSILDTDRAFLNLAMLLFYLPQQRGRSAQVRFHLPEGWKLATLLEGDGLEFQAPNYDALADSPVEAGHFQEYTFSQGFHFTGPNGSGQGEAGVANFRVIVDADPSDYLPEPLLASLRKITATETNLMQDVPFTRYTFLLHFPRLGRGGGMEHRDGTAISIPAWQMRSGMSSFEDVAAHEFFHAWNVKRIRPQALEPVDYVRGNDTGDLWFAEGVTSTYGELALVRAGLISPRVFYSRLADEVRRLQERPARRFQSVETSGQEAWLEKYADYLRPERSISYYNKGELLGFLLDLSIRHATGDRASLDDVMRRLDREFAQQGRAYTRADLRALIAQVAPEFKGVKAFFRDNVQGTRELAYDAYLAYAGLRLVKQSQEVASLGFQVVQNVEGGVQVESVESGSNAQRAGLEAGDLLLKMNGKPLTALPEAAVLERKPGQKVKFKYRRQGRTREAHYALGSRAIASYRVEAVPHASPEQLRLRVGWLTGRTRGR